MRFVHDTLPQRVRFGSGEAAASLRAEIDALGAGRVMLIASTNTMHLAAEIAAEVPVAVRHDEVVMHVPVEVADRAREAARSDGPMKTPSTPDTRTMSSSAPRPASDSTCTNRHISSSAFCR